ncbi:Uncharacterized protein APZ42_031420 [Daphnia magna]|uniref:Uncharacterized protein n=1 Tax=Daphnia magna TaxID=35525 RepID=A0A164MVT5_9CRUS|nr:Uncharacterized protein APZ42_031420 [Daphnia magna]
METIEGFPFSKMQRKTCVTEKFQAPGRIIIEEIKKSGNCREGCAGHRQCYSTLKLRRSLSVFDGLRNSPELARLMEYIFIGQNTVCKMTVVLQQLCDDMKITQKLLSHNKIKAHRKNETHTKNWILFTIWSRYQANEIIKTIHSTGFNKNWQFLFSS